METGHSAYRSAAKHLKPPYSIYIVGCSSRSWYVDRNLLVDVLFMATDAAGVGTSGDRAFTNALLEIAGELGISVRREGAALRDYKLCVALPARGSDIMMSAGAGLEDALYNGIPALVIWPDRQAAYVTTLEEAREPWKPTKKQKKP